jgi:hypothetical protein
MLIFPDIAGRREMSYQDYRRARQYRCRRRAGYALLWLSAGALAAVVALVEGVI